MVIGIDLGGTKIAGGLMDRGGVIHNVVQVPTPAAAGRGAILDAVAGVIERLRAQTTAVAAIGIGTTGLVDADRGRIMYAGGHMHAWTGTAVAAELAARSQLPVVVDNDLNALALGLMRGGPAGGWRCALVLAVGTGVGAALVLGGRVWRGASWSAGEIGHLAVAHGPAARCCNCGHRGHLEAYASGPAIERAYAARRADGLQPDLRQVAARAQAGEGLARTTIRAAGLVCGHGVAGVVGVLDPDVVIVGGGVSAIGPMWQQAFAIGLRRSPLPGPQTVPLEFVAFGLDAALRGAGWLALSKLDETDTPPPAG